MLDRARAGDDRAFAELTRPHLAELHRHCYRMLGSLTDSDDLLQEILTAAWRGLDSYAGRASIRTWLYRIATNRCLNAIRDGRRRVPVAPVPPFAPPEPSRLGEIIWLQPYPDSTPDELGPDAGPQYLLEAAESVELAFVAALQRLPPRQLAVLVLTDVLGFAVPEVAGMLDSTATAVKGTLQRARSRTAELGSTATHLPTDGRGSAAERDLARRFASRYLADDIPGVLALLTDDAFLMMPPAPHEYRGRAAIGALLRASAQWRDHGPAALLPVRCNGQPAFGQYLGTTPGGGIPAVGAVVLTMSGDRISRITRFLDPALPRRIGLPTAVRG